MTLRWPDTLPGVSLPGFSLSPADPSVRTDMSVGQQKVRRITFYRIDRVSTQWKMNDAEFAALRSWYEGLPVSIAGPSDSLAAWGLSNITLSAGAAMGPDAVTLADRVMETAATGVHRASYTLNGANADNINVLCRATIRGAGRTKARLSLIDRASAVHSLDIDLTTGAPSGPSGLVSYAVSDRGGGAWRVTITASTGTGASVPLMRILLEDPTGLVSYAGDITKGIDICELQARIPTGFDLFVPSDADGNGLGCDGGSAWFWVLVAVGGGLSLAEARFSKMYAAPALPGLNRSITAEFEVRNA